MIIEVRQITGFHKTFLIESRRTVFVIKTIQKLLAFQTQFTRLIGTTLFTSFHIYNLISIIFNNQSNRFGKVLYTL